MSEVTDQACDINVSFSTKHSLLLITTKFLKIIVMNIDMQKLNNRIYLKYEFRFFG